MHLQLLMPVTFWFAVFIILWAAGVNAVVSGFMAAGIVWGLSRIKFHV